MLDNLPSGITNNTFGAPWNEVEKEIEFCINVRGLVSISGPIPKHEELEQTHDAKEDVRKEIIAKLDFLYPEYEFT